MSASKLRSDVCDAYSAVALRPREKHPFPVGRQFALSLGYPEMLLASLPPVCVDAYSGVSNVSIFSDIPEGSTVLDLGCGAGLDSLIAAHRTAAHGRVIGIDFSKTMLDRACEGRALAAIGNTIFCRADAEHLPLPDDSIDVALVNGILNLNPAREMIFGELSRVVKRSGVVYAAELIALQPLPPEEQSRSNWFA